MFIHFHSQPFQSRASEEKALELARILTQSQGRSTLFLVPFGEVQREVVTSTPIDLRVVLYRRFMLRLASAIAQRMRAKALVTGESLGQVASQTLTNVATIDDAALMTVLRPLIAFDKQEIIDEALRIGTYEVSVQADEDCCQLFVPRHPETHAKLEQVRAAEAALDIEPMVNDTLERTQVVQLGEQGGTRRTPWSDYDFEQTRGGKKGHRAKGSHRGRDSATWRAAPPPGPGEPPESPPGRPSEQPETPPMEHPEPQPNRLPMPEPQIAPVFIPPEQPSEPVPPEVPNQEGGCSHGDMQPRD